MAAKELVPAAAATRRAPLGAIVRMRYRLDFRVKLRSDKATWN
jgi:hypothetical protein